MQYNKSINDDMQVTVTPLFTYFAAPCTNMPRPLFIFPDPPALIWPTYMYVCVCVYACVVFMRACACVCVCQLGGCVRESDS